MTRPPSTGLSELEALAGRAQAVREEVGADQLTLTFDYAHGSATLVCDADGYRMNVTAPFGPAA